jgi:NhaP-type Na+/H+ or K+/H+ antiporter
MGQAADDNGKGKGTPWKIPKGFGTVLLFVIVYLFLYFLCGSIVLPEGGDVNVPSGAFFSVLLIWATAVLAGQLCAKFKIPELLGMLMAGLILANLPGNLVDGLPDKWSSNIRAAGLSVILMRSGLELDMEAFKKIGWMAVRLTVLPGVSEAIVAGLCATIIFNMTVPLGMCLGFILGAVSPAVVVLGMFKLQSEGFGVFKGIPSLVVAAASFDDVVAITGYTIFKSFALGGGGSMAATVLHGPAEVIGGCLAGGVAGLLCGCTRLWNKRWKRSAVVMTLGLFMMFLARYVESGGGGAMAALAMGICANKVRVEWRGRAGRHLRQRG